MFWSVIAATTLAFFAMVGFEDSVNMAEECKNPSKIFPKVLLTGLLVTGLIYVLVSISAITLVPAAELGEGETPLLKVVSEAVRRRQALTSSIARRLRRLARMETKAISMKATRCSLVRSTIVFNRR
jgi:amino acid transporter